MSSPVFDVVVPDTIWVTERPVWFGGVRLRSRSTVVRLASGGLWVHSPPAPTDDVRRALDALGEVEWLVVPNRFHHLEAPNAAACYPGAKLVGPASAKERNPAVTLALGTEDSSYTEATPELEPVKLRGVPFLDETVFFHQETGTLIAADLLMCAGARDHWTWRAAARLTGRYEKVRTPPDVRMHTRANRETTDSIRQIGALPLKRILVAHADPITDEPARRLSEAWQFASRH